METTCLQHEKIARDTALIPALVEKVDEIHGSLIGTMDRPGWLNRVATVERQMGVVMRVAWGILATLAIGAGSYVWSLIQK